MGDISVTVLDLVHNKIRGLNHGDNQKIALLLPKDISIDGVQKHMLFTKYIYNKFDNRYDYRILLAAINMGITEIPKDTYTDEYVNLHGNGVDYLLMWCAYNDETNMKNNKNIKYPLKVVIYEDENEIPTYEELDGFISFDDNEQGYGDAFFEKDELIHMSYLVFEEFKKCNNIDGKCEKTVGYDLYHKFVKFCYTLD